ncbi:hypothetical protein [Stutzerimonas xanthomarina]|uniref:hypothetical protein n=1 Tax=Stutzerimonas xanthomarina TaxID=271420 RepID=UPI003AA8375F
MDSRLIAAFEDLFYSIESARRAADEINTVPSGISWAAACRRHPEGSPKVVSRPPTADGPGDRRPRGFFQVESPNGDILTPRMASSSSTPKA